LTRFVRSPCIPWRRIGDTIILAPAGRDDFDQLSGTANAVWSLLDRPRSSADLISELAHAYAVSPDEIGPDVLLLISDLVERGAIEECRDRDA
jgi:hypothetical protein